LNSLLSYLGYMYTNEIPQLISQGLHFDPLRAPQQSHC
jgi:hypothetical protein